MKAVFVFILLSKHSETSLIVFGMLENTSVPNFVEFEEHKNLFSSSAIHSPKVSSYKPARSRYTQATHTLHPDCSMLRQRVPLMCNSSTVYGHIEISIIMYLTLRHIWASEYHTICVAMATLNFILMCNSSTIYGHTYYQHMLHIPTY